MFRSNESQMDFEYDNKSGPVDYRSPFLTSAASHQLHQHTDHKKRTFEEFGSPNKQSQFPSLRQPATGASVLFPLSRPSSPTKALPPIPHSKNPAFNTPRKFEPNYDSSEVEQSSPELADSEATPENMGFRSGFAKMSNALTSISDNKGEKSKNPFARLGGSPAGKPEVLKAHYSQAVEKRRTKAKRKEGERRITFRRRGTETEDEATPAAKGGKNDKSSSSTIGSVFGFIETHPDLPHILSFYAQLLLNVFLVFFFIYIIYSFWSTIRSDVDMKSEEAISEIMVEMAACAKSYQENKCDPSTRAPALEVVCNNWEKCMSKDARAVGRARVSAHTFAEIFNSFIEPISYKAMIFSLILVFGCIAISNLAFGFFRNKVVPAQPPPGYMQTPYRQASGQQYVGWNDHPQTPMMMMEPAPSMGAMDKQSPVKRLQYN